MSMRLFLVILLFYLVWMASWFFYCSRLNPNRPQEVNISVKFNAQEDEERFFDERAFTLADIESMNLTTTVPGER